MPESTSQLPHFHTVGFSGHRQLGRVDATGAALGAALADLRRDVPGEWIAISSVAVGGDILFVREALKAGMSWHALLPLPAAEFRKDFSAEEWAEVETLLLQAEQVRIVSESGSREDAYLDCGMETVNACDILLAVWDGEPARGRGGTGDVVAYARELKRPLVMIDAPTGLARRENFNHLHRSDHNLDYFNRLPEAARRSHGHSESDGLALAVAPSLVPVVRFQEKVDRAASKGAPQFRRLIAGTVVLHVLATVVATFALAFDVHGYVLPWIKLLCLLGALGVALVLRYAGAHHNWVRCRMAAEISRSALATWGLPRGAPLFEDLDLADYRQLTRSLYVLHRRAAAAQPMPIGTFKQVYLSGRIDDQLNYYRRRLERALPQLARLRAGFWAFTLFAIVCTGAYAVHASFHTAVLGGRLQELFYYFSPIALPVIAAAFISLISVHDLHRRVARYREMEHLLAANRSQIAYCETWNSLEKVVRRTERALLQEVLEWQSITSFAESH